LQSRLEKQAFQVFSDILGVTVHLLPNLLELQSRLEKQAFQDRLIKIIAGGKMLELILSIIVAIPPRKAGISREVS